MLSPAATIIDWSYQSDSAILARLMNRDSAQFGWRFVALALCLAPLGCASLSKREPVPKEVASCRQLSSQAMGAIDNGQWPQAERLLGQAVKTCPIDVEARRRYAEALWHRGDAAASMGQLEEAARLAPDDPSLALRMGEIYLALDRPDFARRAADQALRIDARLAEAWALRGRALQAGGNLREALADYQRALGLQPRNADVLERLAEVYRQMGQPERALVALQALLEQSPPGDEPPRALHLEGLALMALGRYDDAIDRLQLANARGGGTPDLLCHLGEAQLAAGRAAEARTAATQALALQPNHAPTRALADRLRLAEATPSTRR